MLVLYAKQSSMPKYFQGERTLPYPKERILLADLDAAKLDKLLRAHGGRLSLCVAFTGLGKDCLGYVFNIRQSPMGLEIRDITNKLLFTVASLEELAQMIKHASGESYDARWQQHFQVLRNQIVSEK